MITIEEQWRPVNIPELGIFRKYEVSDIGGVRSFMRSKKPIPRRQKIVAGGYREVSLQLNQRQRYFRVHRLVAWAFPERVKGEYSEETPILHHTSGIKYFNLPEFLEWTDNKGNSKAHYESSEHGLNYVSDKEVYELIGRCYDNPRVNRDELAKEYGCSVGYISPRIHGLKRPDILERFLEDRGISKEEYLFAISGDKHIYQAFSMYYEKGMTYKEIGEELGYHLSLIGYVLNGKTKPHLKEKYELSSNP